MKKYVFLAFLSFMMVLPMLGAPCEQTNETAAKQAILSEKAARFRIETGFVGDIGFSHQSMKFSNYRGNFRDISVTAPQDTAFMKQVFEQVASKVMPHISASEGQLFRENIRRSIGRTSVIYRQIVNGYRLERDGVLNLAYNFATSEFVVTDNTKYITGELVPINISLDHAIQVAIQRYEHNYNYDVNNFLTHPPTQLVYCSIPNPNGSSQFRLCYKIGLSVMVVYIDPSSGEVIHTRKGYKINYH